MVCDQYPIFNELEGKVVSGEEFMIKPDAEIYHCLLDRYSLEASESIFIDDNADNVEGARKVGMHAVQFKNAEQLEKELKEVYGLQF